jgi:hypothetical protein
MYAFYIRQAYGFVMMDEGEKKIKINKKILTNPILWKRKFRLLKFIAKFLFSDTLMEREKFINLN